MIGFGLGAPRPSGLTQRASVARSSSSALRAERRTSSMFFDFGNKKKADARPTAGGTVKGGKKVSTTFCC